MKIFMLNWMDPWNPAAGGAELYCYHVLKQFIERGFDVTWISSRFPGCATDVQESGMRILRMGSLYSTYVRAVSWLNEVVESGDVVFVSMSSVPYPVCHPRAFALIYHLNSLKTMIRRTWFGAPVIYPLQRFGIPILFRNRPVITDSESTCNELRNLGFRDLRVVNDGLTVFPSSFPKTNVVVITGPLKEWKRVHHGITAFSGLDRTWELFVIGRFDSRRYEAKVRRMAERLGLAGRVHFLGYVSETEKFNLYARAKLSIVASEKEGWSLPGLEAAAFGCVTVGYDVPGVRDSLIKGTTSVLVENGNVDALKDAIIRLALDEPLWRKLSANGISRAKEFSWDRTGAEVFDFVSQRIRLCSGRIGNG